MRTIQWERTWEQFKYLQKGFENTRGVRLFYYNGIVEILMPGEAHELFKSIIGFLVETFLFHRAIEFKPTGLMTQEKEGKASASTDVPSSLGKREIDVLKLVGEGKNNTEIAQALYLSEGTVKNHVTQILGKLDMRDRIAAALWAQRHLL